MKSLLLLFQLVAAAYGSDVSCYDHQATDYKSQFSATECNQQCTVTPYFSPDHSLDTYLDLIQSAKESIDIYTPGFDSWIKCTHYSNECDNSCIGCSITDQKTETFPVFPALLNAVHQRGIKVRLLTNNFTQATCQDTITPLDWLHLNKVQVRFYSTTTFMHSKVVIVDSGKRTSISSVNFSQTSFTKNREAGVVIEDCSCPALDLYQSVFEQDWDQALDYMIDYTYSSKDMDVITDDSEMDIPHIDPPSIPGAYVTSKTSYKDVTVTRGYTSPDGALDVIMSDLSKVQSSLHVAIYQITDSGICNQLLKLHQDNVNISILVSARIVSYTDYKLAQECYGMLYKAGMQGSIRKALTKFSFAHQKYWIVDGQTVHLSTGNWSPSDFPKGSTFAPYSRTKMSINRDLLVSMEGEDIVRAFQTVFSKDWDSGTEWVPKYRSNFLYL